MNPAAAPVTPAIPSVFKSVRRFIGKIVLALNIRFINPETMVRLRSPTAFQEDHGTVLQNEAKVILNLFQDKFRMTVASICFFRRKVILNLFQDKQME